MAKPLKPIKMASSESIETGAPLMGERIIETVRGPVLCNDAPGFTTMLGKRPDPKDSRVVVLIYTAPDPAAGAMGKGLVAQLDAAAARTFGASFMRLADMLDAEGAK
jgi:hypothetical protein